MIQLQLFDSFKNELQLDDIILAHYPNPNVKLLGILKFLEDSVNIVLQYETEEDITWMGFKSACSYKIERIGSAKEYPNLLKHCAYYNKKKDVKMLETILTRINDKP